MKVRGSAGLILGEVTPPTPSAGHVALYSPTGAALLMKDDAGVVTTIGGGSPISGLTAVTTPVGTDEFVVNQGGTSKKMTLSQINQYAEPLSNASVAAQSPAAATDVYITGSNLTIPSARMQAGVMYRLRMIVTKTAAGVAAPVFNVRYGTATSIADTSRGVLTMGVQTATINTVLLELLVTFRSYSSTGVLQSGIGASMAGFPVTGAAATSAAFDMTVASSKIGVSVNTGAAAAWTFTIVQADFLNIL